MLILNVEKVINTETNTDLNTSYVDIKRKRHIQDMKVLQHI